MRLRHLLFVVLIPLLAACADKPPAPAPSQTVEHFDPAPMPFVTYVRRNGSGYQPGGLPVPPKMPPGTGAYQVPSGPVRGYVTTGFSQAF